MGNNQTVIEYSPAADLDDLSPGFRTFCIIFQSILALSGSAGNLLTILAVVVCKKLRRTHNAYIAHLALVDFFISSFLIPLNIVGLYRRKSHDESAACKVIAVVSLIALVLSVLNLFMVSLNRYILICKGMFTYTKMYNKKTVPLSILLLWGWAILVVTPMLAADGVGWSQKTHYCFFRNYYFFSYIYITVGLAQAGVVLPAAATSVCYVMIIKKLRTTARKLAPKSPNSLVKEPVTSSGSSNYVTATYDDTAQTAAGNVDDVDEDDFGEVEQVEVKSANRSSLTAKSKKKEKNDEHIKRQRAKQRAHNRRVGGLIIIFMVFMVCWLPIAVTFTIDYKQKLPGLVYVTLISVAWINSSINVFMYGYTNPTYRHAFRCILKCRFSEINKSI